MIDQEKIDEVRRLLLVAKLFLPDSPLRAMKEVECAMHLLRGEGGGTIDRITNLVEGLRPSSQATGKRE